MTSPYFVVIKSGSVVIFEGAMETFRKHYYDYPADWTDEEVMENVQEWAAELKWTVEYHTCH